MKQPEQLTLADITSGEITAADMMYHGSGVAIGIAFTFFCVLYVIWVYISKDDR